MCIYSFTDTMHEGEQFGTEDRLAIMSANLPRDYTKILSLARYRAASQPYLWGPEHLMGSFLVFEWVITDPIRQEGRSDISGDGALPRYAGGVG